VNSTLNKGFGLKISLEKILVGLMLHPILILIFQVHKSLLKNILLSFSVNEIGSKFIITFSNHLST